MRLAPHRAIALGSSALLLALCACSPTDGPPSTEPATDASGPLVLYSGRSESLVGPLIQAYREETGSEIEVRYGGTAELAATLLEEGDRSPADLFYAQDPGGLGAVDALLAPLPDETLARVADGFRDGDGRWVGVSGRARVVAYHRATLAPADLPQDLKGFTDATWQGRIGWAPSNASFQTMVTGMRAAWGEAATRSWLEGILANDPVAYASNTPLVAAVAAGEVEVGLTNHYYLYRFLAEEGDDFGARNHFLAGGGPGSLVMVSGVGVLSSSARPKAARALVDYLLDENAQSYFASTTYEYPLAAGIPPAVELPALESLNLVDLSLGELADLQGTVTLLQEVGALP
jgi:iron(III) transport system substrate-binding protein